MSEWVAELGGETLSLKALAMMFHRPALSVIQRLEDGHYFLKSSDFTSLDLVIEVWKHASTLVTRMNAAGVLKFGSFQPVSVLRTVRSDAMGREEGPGYSVNWR